MPAPPFLSEEAVPASIWNAQRQGIYGLLQKRGGSGATESRTGKKAWSLGFGNSWKTRQFLMTRPGWKSITAPGADAAGGQLSRTRGHVL